MASDHIAAKLPLAELQRRFHAAATGASSLDDASALVAGDLATARGRLAIYRRMYRDRLVDCITGDYPKLAALLGARWRPLVEEHLRHRPPSHPDIRDSGRDLATFLDRRDRGWEADLARLEWARSDVFYAADAPASTRGHLAAVAPDDFPAVQLRLVPASSLVRLGHNADDLWAAIEEETTVPDAYATAARTVLVWRRDVAVFHRTVDPDEASILPILVTGVSFEAVCSTLCDLADDPVPRATELLLRWLDAGLLSSEACSGL